MAKPSLGIGALLVKLSPKLWPLIQKFGDVLFPLVKSNMALKSGLVLASAGVYSFLFTWQTALALMAFIAIHEYGHIWAMERCGMKTRGMYFIPGMGAAAVTEEMIGSARNEAFIALLGPYFGLIFFVVPVTAYAFVKSSAHAASIASLMVVINCINMLPIMPLDGGRLMKSVAYSYSPARSLATISCVSLVTIVFGALAGFNLLVVMGVVGFVELFAHFGIKDYMGRVVRTVVRILCVFWLIHLVPSILKDAHDGKVWMTIFGCALVLLVVLLAMFDAYIITGKLKALYRYYPLLVVAEVIGAGRELLNLRKLPIKAIPDYGIMSRGDRVKWVVRFLVLLAVHVGFIVVLDTMSGGGFGKEFLS